MEPSMIQIVQLIVALTGLIVSAALTVLVYRGTRQIAEAQYWRSVRETWMDIDKFALADDRNLRVADSLFHPDSDNQPLEEARKRWFAYMVLNAFVSMYYGTVDPQLGTEAQHSERAKAELKPLLRDNTVYRLTQSGVYTADFANVCRQLREAQGLPTD